MPWRTYYRRTLTSQWRWSCTTPSQGSVEVVCLSFATQWSLINSNPQRWCWCLATLGVGRVCSGSASGSALSREPVRRSGMCWYVTTHCQVSPVHSLVLPQEIQPNSPAAQANLVPHTDYILGADLMGIDDDLYSVIENNDQRVIRFYVYNSETDRCREVSTLMLNKCHMWCGDWIKY